MNVESEAKRKELAQLVKYLLKLEEIQHVQRSRVNWLHNGDRSNLETYMENAMPSEAANVRLENET